jgi:hypothetical protein
MKNERCILNEKSLQFVDAIVSKKLLAKLLDNGLLIPKIRFNEKQALALPTHSEKLKSQLQPNFVNLLSVFTVRYNKVPAYNLFRVMVKRGQRPREMID